LFKPKAEPGKYVSNPEPAQASRQILAGISENIELRKLTAKEY